MGAYLAARQLGYVVSRAAGYPPVLKWTRSSVCAPSTVYSTSKQRCLTNQMGSTTTSAVGQFLRQRSDAFAEEGDSAKGLVRSTVIPIPAR